MIFNLFIHIGYRSFILTFSHIALSLSLLEETKLHTILSARSLFAISGFGANFQKKSFPKAQNYVHMLIIQKNR
jgi:hypothetical protein